MRGPGWSPNSRVLSCCPRAVFAVVSVNLQLKCGGLCCWAWARAQD